MTTETMTVTRALAELKTLHARIAAATAKPFLGIIRGKDGTPFMADQPDADGIRANYESVATLMKRRSAIKAAVVASNAITTVVIGNSTYTVASAIESKSSAEMTDNLIRNLKHQMTVFSGDISRNNAALEQKIDTQVMAVFGKDSKKTVTDTDYQSVRQPMLDQHELRLLDPLGVSSVIEKLEKEQSDFLLNVDYALSEANAVTTITVEY